MCSLCSLCSMLLLCMLPQPGSCSASPNTSLSNHSRCSGVTGCSPGVMLPVWSPELPELRERLVRASIYFLGMAYMFLGVSIIADRFMASIEVITSQERRVTVRSPGGEKVTATVRVWNETVSNLSLMALGSSAPEILLSVVEVCGHGFQAGQLGPNTIVGSAAFNMFVIIGLCVSVVPDDQRRRIKHLRVFFVTAAWSIFAYTWLYLILAVFSPGVVEVWEGLLTLLFFPLCVGLAYVADRRLLFYGYVHKRYRATKRGVIIQTEGEPELPAKMELEVGDSPAQGGQEEEQEEERSRRQTAFLLKELRQQHPDKPAEQLLELASYQLLLQRQKSRAFYRCQAGIGDPLKREAASKARRAVLTEVCSGAPQDPLASRVFFQPGSYQVLEDCGAVVLNVVRRGGDLNRRVAVDYHTEDGTALAGADYRACRGTLEFGPGQAEMQLQVHIVDDDVFEEDEHFLVHLSNVQSEEGSAASLGLPCSATVTIVDDDHAGVFTFQEPLVAVSESVGMMEVKVLRLGGARGAVALPYRTLEGSARGGGHDYEDAYGLLEFNDHEVCKSILINIIDDEEYEKNKNMFLEIGDPHLMEMSLRKAVLLQEAGGFVKTDKWLHDRDIYRKLQGRDLPHPGDVITLTDDVHKEVLSKAEEEERRIAELGRPCLGEHSRLEVIIQESYQFKNTVDRLLKRTNLALVVGTNSWREQFRDAITVSAGDEDAEGLAHEPSGWDYTLHYMTVFWKLLFAVVPPAGVAGGWPCFLVSIIIIGWLTAIIGDLASHFGCTLGLKDSVTAVVFVALGTSVPDTFASKLAAVQDQYADASIGNVTGSNAVNVFLGIGVAWSLAAIYHGAHGEQFRVDPGTLAFSVTLFTIFAFVCVAVLLYRRRPPIGGELGGPRTAKLLTTGLFFSLWLLYILLSSLEAYCHIQGF